MEKIAPKKEVSIMIEIGEVIIGFFLSGLAL